MSDAQIISQAVWVLPALAAIWIILFLVYRVSNIITWPRFGRFERWIDRWTSFETESLSGFNMGSIALISLISLYLELLLIRWITSEIRIFAYFKSLVLIACFLGFGLGFYLARRKIRLILTLAPILGLILIIDLPWDPFRNLVMNLSGFIGWFSDVHIFSRAYFAEQSWWGLASALIAISIVIPLFGLIAMIFIPFGQIIGWYFENTKRGIQAYSVNLIASIAGIWLFTGLSFLSSPPPVWLILACFGMVIYFWFLPRIRLSVVIFSAVAVGLLLLGSQKTMWWNEQSWKGSSLALCSLQPGKVDVDWSPYQKLTLVPLLSEDEVVRFVLNTNDSWFQQILDLSEEAVERHPELCPDLPLKFHRYNLPYRFYEHPDEVLIAGSGMGNDVAAALRNGAGHITAVEIDPLIVRKGQQLHFEQPYQSDRVEVVIDDARSFIQNTDKTFNLIVFSILDSHTTNSYYTNIRLDNYVYTVEAMEATRKLLKPDGVFAMSFNSERPWFAGHLHDVLVEVYGKEPLLFRADSSFFVVSESDRVETVLAGNLELKEFVASRSEVKLEGADLITDDWPYLYQQYRGIPFVVWVLSLGLLAVSWVTFRRLKQNSGGIQWHFFFLGAAFLLLEVQIISRIALLFGTTWLVNSIVISVLLLFSLLSNYVIYRFPQFPRRIAYIGLLVMILIGFLIPTNALFIESLLLRGLAVALIYCSPVFFAGLIFVSGFKQVGFQAEAFGSNLFGSLVGGLLESLSFLVGIRALVILAGLLYIFSWLTLGRLDGEASKGVEKEIAAEY